MSNFNDYSLVKISRTFDQRVSQIGAHVTGLNGIGRPVPTAIALGIAVACIDGGMSGCLYGAIDAAIRSATNNEAGAMTAVAVASVVGSECLMNGMPPLIYGTINVGSQIVSGAIYGGGQIVSGAIYGGGQIVSGAVTMGGRLVSCGQDIPEPLRLVLIAGCLAVIPEPLRLGVIAGCLAVIRLLTTPQEQVALGIGLVSNGVNRYMSPR
jgi:hypothetical protein